MRASVFALAMILAACPAPRAPVDITVARSASVQLVDVVNGTLVRRCGGVWIAEDRFVTAAHCLPSPVPGATYSYALRGEDTTRGARFLAATRDDVAVLQVSMPAPGHAYVSVVDAQPGEPAYVESHVYGIVRGTLHDFDTIAATLAKGDSGSGVFVGDGVAGIVSRRDEFGVEFAHAAEIRAASKAADAVKLPTITPPVWEAEE